MSRPALDAWLDGHQCRAVLLFRRLPRQRKQAPVSAVAVVYDEPACLEVTPCQGGDTVDDALDALERHLVSESATILSRSDDA